jgi:hypothetical protein
VADPWEQVVFDLKVQAANKPRDYSTTPGEVHSRLRLMDCPRVVHIPGTRSGHWELRLSPAVCHLKHHTQHGAHHQPGDAVVEEDDTEGMEQQGNPKCQSKEGRFAGREDHEVPTPRAGEWLVTDPGAGPVRDGRRRAGNRDRAGPASILLGRRLAGKEAVKERAEGWQRAGGRRRMLGGADESQGARRERR